MLRVLFTELLKDEKRESHFNEIFIIVIEGVFKHTWLVWFEIFLFYHWYLYLFPSIQMMKCYASQFFIYLMKTRFLKPESKSF